MKSSLIALSICNKNLTNFCERFQILFFQLAYGGIMSLFGIILNIIVVAGSCSAFFSIGWSSIANRLLSSHETVYKLPKTLFTVTFTVSCCLFEFLLFEILDILDDRYESIRWAVGIASDNF